MGISHPEQPARSLLEEGYERTVQGRSAAAHLPEAGRTLLALDVGERYVIR
ncbi:MAG TPA: hypothetical protein VJ961_08700 [Mariprofundaceae bacterium]|nr:hypothetical protein [Mariprofundaceae bacterium]